MFKVNVKKYAEKLKSLGRPLTVTGAEKLDPTPLAPPLGFVPRIPLYERIREMVRSEQMALRAELEGKETFAEANDFGPEDEDDDPMPVGIRETTSQTLREWGVDIQRSKREQKRLAEAEDRFATKIAKALRPEEFEEETPVSRPRRRKSPESERSPEAPSPRELDEE